jgi:hypothetical protein
MENYRMESRVIPGEGGSGIWMRNPEELSGVRGSEC